jgi:hypothetical protein
MWTSLKKEQSIFVSSESSVRSSGHPIFDKATKTKRTNILLYIGGHVNLYCEQAVIYFVSQNLRISQATLEGVGVAIHLPTPTP